jgi:hypothetical protein
MLLLDDDDQLSDSPTEEETLLAESLGAAGLLAIDEAIGNASSRTRWLKVARVVVDAIRAAGFSTEEAHVQLHVRRTIALVSSGRLDAQGNVHRPRFSEVRAGGSPMMPPNTTFDRTAGSHSLATAGQRER